MVFSLFHSATEGNRCWGCNTAGGRRVSPVEQTRAWIVVPISIDRSARREPDWNDRTGGPSRPDFQASGVLSEMQANRGFSYSVQNAILTYHCCRFSFLSRFPVFTKHVYRFGSTR